MARIRTIKPVHWNDKELPKITLGAHLFWIATWNFSDDEGVFENDLNFLKNQIFPRRTDIRMEQISQWIDQLVKARFIIPFVFENASYYIHRTFKIHQKIDKPQPSKIPVNIIRRTLHELSATVRPCIGEESNGKEGSGEPPAPYFEPLKKNSGRNNAGAEKFLPPSLKEVEEFFKNDPEIPIFWPPAKRETEAGKYFNHYTATGWKQAKGNLIVDWRAQAKSWITKDQEGTFSRGLKNNNSPPAAQKLLSKIERDINTLYSDFVGRPANISISNIDALHYEYLMKKEMIDFSEDLGKEIRNQVKVFMKENHLQVNDQTVQLCMKKFGVVEFFKEQLRQGKEVIFKSNQ